MTCLRKHFHGKERLRGGAWGGEVAKEYYVRILNWKKYQSREVKTRSIWFRLQNDFIDNPNFCTFSSNERMVWLHAMCCASKLNKDIIHVPLQCNHHALVQGMNVDEKTFHHTFEKLKKLHIVEIRTTRGRYADDTCENADDTLQDKTGQRQDETRQDKDFSSERSEERIEAVIACYSSLQSTFSERKVSRAIQERWTKAFPESEWVVEQINKALAWEASNPSRKKKNFPAFITRWLTKGWDFRKTSPNAPKVDWGKVFGDDKESA